MEATTPQAVIACFSRSTGIRFRVLPHSVQRQAGDFVKAGFTLEELELTIAWIKRQIGQRKSGFTEASYTWKRLFGEHGAADEWQVFQERLGMAEKERARGWRPTLESAPAEPKKAPAVAAPDPEKIDQLSAEAAAGLAAWCRSQRPTMTQT